MDFVYQAAIKGTLTEYFAAYGLRHSIAEKDLNAFGLLVRNSRIILVDPNGGVEKPVDISEEEPEGLNLPFAECYFENARLNHNLFGLDVDPERMRPATFVWAIAAFERGADYTVVMLTSTEKEWAFRAFNSEDRFTKPDHFMSSVEFVVNALYNKTNRVGEVRANERLKLRHGKEAHKVKRLIVIQPSTSNTTSINSRPIEWKHSWEVMGHWRRVEGIGKTRNGEYCVQGKTWVTPHAKGDGPLIQKTRLVKDRVNMQLL